MKKIFTIVMLVAVMAVSCSTLRKFDRVDTTSVERYKVVYSENRCGLFDIEADSLVTEVMYNSLKFARIASEQGREFTIWVSELDDYNGLIAIESATNESMEIMIPKQ